MPKTRRGKKKKSGGGYDHDECISGRRQNETVTECILISNSDEQKWQLIQEIKTSFESDKTDKKDEPIHWLKTTVGEDITEICAQLERVCKKYEEQNRSNEFKQRMNPARIVLLKGNIPESLGSSVEFTNAVFNLKKVDCIVTILDDIKKQRPIHYWLLYLICKITGGFYAPYDKDNIDLKKEIKNCQILHRKKGIIEDYLKLHCTRKNSEHKLSCEDLVKIIAPDISRILGNVQLYPIRLIVPIQESGNPNSVLAFVNQRASDVAMRRCDYDDARRCVEEFVKEPVENDEQGEEGKTFVDNDTAELDFSHRSIYYAVPVIDLIDSLESFGFGIQNVVIPTENDQNESMGLAENENINSVNNPTENDEVEPMES